MMREMRVKEIVNSRETKKEEKRDKEEEMR